MKINYNNAITSNFKLTFPSKPELEFKATSVNVPGVTLSPIEVPYRDTRAKVPDNRYMWDDLNVQFVMDEDLYVYELITKWNQDVRNKEFWQSSLIDVNIVPLDSNKIIEYCFVAEGCWPSMIGSWQYSTTSSISDYIMLDVTFSYQNFRIQRVKPLEFSIV